MSVLINLNDQVSGAANTGFQEDAAVRTEVLSPARPHNSKKVIKSVSAMGIAAEGTRKNTNLRRHLSKCHGLA